MCLQFTVGRSAQRVARTLKVSSIGKYGKFRFSELSRIVPRCVVRDDRKSVLLSDFDFHLPDDLIAQEPLPDRAASRMLVVDRTTGKWEDRMFRDFPTYLHPNDCLVLNDSRVLPSRLYGHREHGTGRVELLLTKPISADGLTWEALVRPGRKLPTGERIVISDDLTAEILERAEFGERAVRLHPVGDLFDVLDRVGHMPLPPYIRRPDTSSDRERYQTVFARERGSAAAPTAGLHFTPEILAACKAAGAEIAHVTLHVGLGTFQPLRSESLDEIHLHKESMVVPPETTAAMDRARRVVAVGTTAVRAIESDPAAAETDIFIQPGFQFRRTGAMLTNFHLPKSSLLVLVCALVGRELTLAAYQHAISQKYRFYSYGDCMLII
jgi:S-adenosylmethionine:tRNA ribosyltransferase-isomerase